MMDCILAVMMAIVAFITGWILAGINIRRQKKTDRAEHRIENTQRNIGNRVCNALNDAADQNPEAHLRAKTIFCNGGEVYRVYLSFDFSGADLLLVDIDPRQSVPITVFFNKSRLEKYYDITEGDLVRLIQMLQEFVVNYSPER